MGVGMQVCGGAWGLACMGMGCAEALGGVGSGRVSACRCLEVLGGWCAGVGAGRDVRVRVREEWLEVVLFMEKSTRLSALKSAN